ncbi:MAG: response regulator [Anaerolineales bacterium]
MNKSVSSPSPAPVRILIVDDHPNTASTLARAMSQLGPGIEILTAESGEQALELSKDLTVDLLITDMVMPGINGLELIEKMQAHPGGRPAYTALVTAFDVPGLKESARRLKVNDVLNKPIRPERMSQIIGKAIEDLGRAPTSPVETTKSQLKILIADDRSDNITLLSRYLENEGYVCLTALDGEQALIKTRTEMPDLVLLDVNMPVKDGFEALQEIRSDPAIAHIPVIILTAARLEPMDMQYALNIGADDYVTKPFDRRELLARIRTRLRVKETEDYIRLRNKELNLLPEIGRELSARLDIDELTNVVLRRTVETLGAWVGHMILLTPQGPSFKSYHFSSSPSPAVPEKMPSLTDLLAQVTQTRQGITIVDAHNDTRWPVPPEDPTHAIVIVPMFGRLGLLGLLVLAHEQSGYFRLEHRLLLQAIAGQAAIAVENAQLYSSAAREQQRMAAVLEKAADAILMFDADGKLSLLNPAGGKLFSNGNAKLGARLARGVGYESFVGLLEETLKSGEAQTSEIVWPDQRAFSVSFTPIEAGGCVAILNDVSRFKVLEQAKNNFISTATHSMKNTLTKITLMSQLIPKLGTLNKKQSDYIRNISETAIDMDRLVQNMLALAKIDAGGLELKREPVKINDLVSRIAEEFQVQAKAREQELQFEPAEAEPEIQGDSFQLEQALRNLVSNALKYTPEKGSIVLCVQAGPDSVTIDVKDNGYGIPQTELPFIFDRFYRVYNDQLKDIEGDGLGLSIVKSIVEQHAGQVRVESEFGKGSCFSIVLPLRQVHKLALPSENQAINQLI